ncbi:SDR family oxidoreductase, partial [Alphaproteobacteria bacterium]|nr:SDR family oxidoreductase [Alphaproteobacteria bacterium]
ALRLFKSVDPGLVINLAAMTNVDECELNTDAAFRANTLTVQNIVDATKAHGLKPFFIHFSTDQLYDNRFPSTEENVVIQNHYSMTKYAGELALRSVPSMILRTNFFGRSTTENRKSFTDWMYNCTSEQGCLNLFDDVYFNPLHISTVCELLDVFIKRRKTGIFNLGSANGMSKAQFGAIFLSALGFDTNCIKPISVEENTKLIAKRPKFMLMNVSKLEKTFGITLPNLEDEIKKCDEEFN